MAVGAPRRPGSASGCRRCSARRPIDEARLATEVAVLGGARPTSPRSWRGSARTWASSRALLDEGGLVGRTLDFLIQEINREVNTVGSKADDLEISQAVIAAKSTAREDARAGAEP